MAKRYSHSKARPERSPAWYRFCGIFYIILGIILLLLSLTYGMLLALVGVVTIIISATCFKMANNGGRGLKEAVHTQQVSQKSETQNPTVSNGPNEVPKTQAWTSVSELSEDRSTSETAISSPEDTSLPELQQKHFDRPQQSDSTDYSNTEETSVPETAFRELEPTRDTPPQPPETRSVSVSQDKPVILQQQESFDETLRQLPRVPVGTDGSKIKIKVSELPELKYRNITAQSNYDKLGAFVAIDTETTGLHASRDKIVEVAAVKFVDYEPVSVFSTLINPQKPIPPTASSINNITDEMVKNSPTIWQVIPSLNEYIGTVPIVGHNLPFDLDFLCRAGLNVSKKQNLYDTLQLAKRTVKQSRPKWDRELRCFIDDFDFFDSVPNYKLETLCRHFLICDHCDHRAEGDALAAGHLFHELTLHKTGKFDEMVEACRQELKTGASENDG